jgi:hypothetical protein
VSGRCRARGGKVQLVKQCSVAAMSGSLQGRKAGETIEYAVSTLNVASPVYSGPADALDIHADAAHAAAIIGQKSWAPVAERPVALPPTSEEARHLDHLFSVSVAAAVCRSVMPGYASRSVFSALQ